MACTGGTFFGLPHWWQYMKTGSDSFGQCTPAFSGPNDLLPIALAVVGILLWAAGFAAVVSIIISGVQFITASGNVEKAAAARKRIINALIGLGIALTAISFVAFLGDRLVK